MEPYEIIAAPFAVWVAPEGEPFPAIDAAPGGNWVLVGISGDKNYTEEGITLTHSQTMEDVRVLGTTGPRKAFRTAEDLKIGFTVLDLSLEEYARAIGDNPVTTTAAGVGTAGFKTLGLHRGLDVKSGSLLVRGNVSAYGKGMNSQYEVPRCYQSGNPAPVLRKGQPAGLAMEFTALEDLNAASDDERFGRLIVQHQDPLP